VQRLRRIALMVATASLLASLPGLLHAAAWSQDPAGQQAEPLAWQTATDPARPLGAEPRRSAPPPASAHAVRLAFSDPSADSVRAGRRAYLTCRRGGDDLPAQRPLLFRRMGGADEPDSPSR